MEEHEEIVPVRGYHQGGSVVPNNTHQHVFDTGPVSFARLNDQGGYRFCSCGNWHWQQSLTPNVEWAAA